jgi:hypothetical protein
MNKNQFAVGLCATAFLVSGAIGMTQGNAEAAVTHYKTAHT